MRCSDSDSHRCILPLETSLIGHSRYFRTTNHTTHHDTLYKSRNASFSPFARKKVCASFARLPVVCVLQGFFYLLRVWGAACSASLLASVLSPLSQNCAVSIDGFFDVLPLRDRLTGLHWKRPLATPSSFVTPAPFSSQQTLTYPIAPSPPLTPCRSFSGVLVNHGRTSSEHVPTTLDLPSFPALVLSQPPPVLPPVPPVAGEGVNGRDRDVAYPLNCSFVLKIKAHISM